MSQEETRGTWRRRGRERARTNLTSTSTAKDLQDRWATAGEPPGVPQAGGGGGGALGVGGGRVQYCRRAGRKRPLPRGAVTTAAPASTTTTAPASTTTVSAGPEVGRPVKLGYVVPITGPLAPFAAAGKWALKHFEDAIGEGLVLGDKMMHPFEVSLVDTQSDSNRAAQVTGDLIQNTKVDLVMAAVTPDTVNPAGDVAEAMGCPLISNWTEVHAFTLGRKMPPEGFNGRIPYAFDDVLTTVNYTGLLPQVPSNKVVGLVLATMWTATTGLSGGRPSSRRLATRS